MNLLTKLTIVSLLFLLIFSLGLSTTKSYAANEIKEVDTVPSHNYTIVIDAGHGGFDVK